jgi:23S rRNA pseudouridine1911/1915/1917 synthase
MSLPFSSKTPPPQSFDILGEGAEWIAVNKPSGLLTHPTKPGGPPTLWHGLRDLLAFEVVNGGKIALINRLDRETSGITLAAKTTHSASRLASAMAGGEIHKKYLAIVLGWPPQDEFKVMLPILRLGEVAPSAVWLKRAIHPAGAPAKTLFYVQKRSLHPLAGKISLVQAVPLTGRTHQIRVHLSHIGYPIVGDKLYGISEKCYLQFIEEGWNPSLEKLLYMPRHALHSAKLEATIKNFSIICECPMPWDMKNFLNQAQ